LPVSDACVSIRDDQKRRHVACERCIRQHTLPVSDACVSIRDDQKRRHVACAAS
jgi:hypothetical protein